MTLIEDDDRNLLKQVVKQTGAQMQQRVVPPQVGIGTYKRWCMLGRSGKQREQLAIWLRAVDSWSTLPRLTTGFAHSNHEHLGPDLGLSEPSVLLRCSLSARCPDGVQTSAQKLPRASDWQLHAPMPFFTFPPPPLPCCRRFCCRL